MVVVFLCVVAIVAVAVAVDVAVITAKDMKIEVYVESVAVDNTPNDEKFFVATELVNIRVAIVMGLCIRLRHSGCNG